MSYIKKKHDKEAQKHESEGGSCKTILLNGVEVKACLDAKGQIMDEALRKYAELTGQ